MTESLTSAEPLPQSSAERPGLRNAWQWLAMVTMILDHIGYLYDISPLRYVGRLGMPLYAMLFVLTLQKGQLRMPRLLWLAMLSQFPFLYIFQIPQLNIIFGFAIFGWTADAVRQRGRLKILVGFLMMWIPVSYGWYLYLTLATFHWVKDKPLQRSIFAILTGFYTCLSQFHWRQLLAILAPFIEGVRMPRPNKYIYRYFYPGHLLILAVLKYGMIGTVTLPFGPTTPTKHIGNYYEPNAIYEYYDNEIDPLGPEDWDIIDWSTDDAASY